MVTTGLIATLAAGGCARGDTAQGQSPSSTSRVEFVQELHDRLPATVRTRHQLRFATDPAYAPMESFAADGRTIIGFEPDLAAALGVVVGVEVEMVPTSFSTALDGLATGGYHGVLSSMTDTLEREAKADFVNYFSAGTSIVVRRGNPKGITDLTDLCGQIVAVETATVQVGLLQRTERECDQQTIAIKENKTSSDALVELRTGRAVAVLTDYPPAVHLSNDARTRSQYQLASTVQYEPGLYGIAVAKGNPELRDVLRDALDRLIRSGAYGELLQRWGLSSGALRSSSVNAGGGVIAEG